MRKLILLLLLLGACTGVSYEEHTDAGSKYVLSNGMTVIMKENPDTGMVAADLMIKRSIAANGKKYGLGHFTTRILLAGTETRTREDITREVEAVGGSITARTYWRWTLNSRCRMRRTAGAERPSWAPSVLASSLISEGV